MKKVNVIEQLNPEIPKTELKIIDLFDTLETKEERQNDFIKDFDFKLTKKFNKLKERLEQCSIKVNTAIFGDKKFLNESYAYEIPLNKNYFEDNQNIKFNENILTNTASKSSKENRTELDIKSITSRKNTVFNFKNKILTIEKNDIYSYQEIQINLPKNINSGMVYIEFNKYDNISLLNKYGKEIIPKSITNSITQPVSKDTEALIIRFNSNDKRELSVLDFYVSENSFNLESIVFSKPIGIYQDLKEIGLNTCDNYSDINSDIKYEISINKGAYREIRPLNKQKNLNVNSILSVDDGLTYYKLTDSIYNDNLRLYTTDHFDNESIYLMKSFDYKLGDDLGLLIEEEFYLYLEEDHKLYINTNDRIVLNDEVIEGSEERQEVILRKGFNNLKVPNELWNQDINMLKYEIIDIKENILKIRSKEDGSIINKVSNYNKQNSIFLQLVLEGSIFTHENKEKTYYVNERLYITKSKNKDNHVFIKYKTNYVETIKLKITLKSLTKTNPVYISSMTIRGI